MPASELSEAFGLQLEPEVAAELNEHLAAADEVVALEDAPAATSKLALLGTGTTLYAKFSPGPHGSGSITKKGTGGFAGKKQPPSLQGEYTLDVGRLTVKLSRGSTTIWSGYGAQKGLSGKWNVKF